MSNASLLVDIRTLLCLFYISQSLSNRELESIDLGISLGPGERRSLFIELQVLQASASQAVRLQIQRQPRICMTLDVILDERLNQSSRSAELAGGSLGYEALDGIKFQNSSSCMAGTRMVCRALYLAREDTRC